VIDKRALDFVTPLGVNFAVRVLSMAVMFPVVVSLTVFEVWDLRFAITWEAALLVACAAVLTWLVGFGCFFLALHAGKVSVVVPITSSDPLFAALFAALLLGSTLTGSTIVGVLVSLIGIVLLARWMEPEDEAHVGVEAAPAEDSGVTSLAAIFLAIAAAAAWGCGPVLVEMAEDSLGTVSATMMLESQVIGFLVIGAVVLVRRAPLLTRPLEHGERRLVRRLLLASGILEATFAILYYLCIDQIGAVMLILVVATAPVFSIAGSIVFLKEKVSSKLLLAAAITVSGVMIAAAERAFM